MDEGFIKRICDDFCDDFYDRQNYNECIEKANIAFDLFKDHSVDINYYLWTCLIMIARSYNKLGDFENSIQYTLQSMNYVETKDKEIEGLWTLARCYAIHNDLLNSDYYFNQVSNYYKETNNNLFLAKVYNMKAWYFKDLELAKESYKILKELRENEKRLGIYSNKSKVYLEIEEVKDTIQEIMKS